MTPVISLGYKRPLKLSDLSMHSHDDEASVLVERFRDRFHINQQAEKRKLGLNPEDSLPASRNGPILWRTILDLTKRGILIGSCFRFVSDFFGYMGPVLLEQIVSYCDQGAGHKPAPFLPEYYGYILAAVLLVTQTFRSVFFQTYSYLLIREGTRVRACATALIFDKVLKMTVSEKDDIGAGRITNTMSTDLRRIELFYWFAVHIVFGPLQIIVCIGLLVWILGPLSALGGLVIMIALMPIQIKFAKQMGKFTKRGQGQTDKRVQLTGELISGIRVVKYNSWEESFWECIAEARDAELYYVFKSRVYQALSMLAVNATPVFVSVCSFVIYVYSSDTKLTAAKAFSSVGLFSLMRMPLIMLPRLSQYIVEAKVAATRVASLLGAHEVRSVASRTTDEVGSIDMSGYEFRRHPQHRDPVLTLTGFRISPGELVMCTGAVGSGKSFLMSCILGDMYSKETTSSSTSSTAGLKFVASASRLAYVSQSAWIVNATLRENILFGRPFEQHKYDRTIKACALQLDLDMLPHGDQTEIGERGINLSGGQKQRISIARAVYGYDNTDIFLFDDPFSALDSHVTETILQEAVLGMLANKTRIVVTHRVLHAKHANRVIFMESEGQEVAENGEKDSTASEPVQDQQDKAAGTKPAMTKQQSRREYRQAAKERQKTRAKLEKARQEGTVLLEEGGGKIWISEIGSFEDLKQKDEGRFATFLRLAAPKLEMDTDQKAGPSVDGESEKISTEPVPSDSKAPKDGTQNSSTGSQNSAKGPTSSGGKLTEKETRLTGTIDTSVYIMYLKASGAIFVLLMFIGAEGGKRWSDQWLSRMTSSLVKASDTEAIQIYTIISCGSVVMMLISEMLAAYWGVRGARSLHNRMLKTLLRAPVSFYDTTPSGRMLNRFSNDVNVLDRDLPPVLSGFLLHVVEISSILVVVCVATRWFAIPLIPIGMSFFFLQQYYRRTSRELKRIDNISKSPLFILLTETLEGLPTIRAYQSEARLQATNYRRINDNFRAYMSSNGCNWWLGERLDFLGALSAFAVAMMVVSMRFDLSAGLIGLALSYTLNVTSKMNWFVRQTIELESRMNSIERVLEYTAIDPEGTVNGPAARLSHVATGIPSSPRASPRPSVAGSPGTADEWPSKGSMTFSDVTMRYRPNSPLVVKGLSFHIDGGERVGLVGRTGAGKSSVTNLLYRIVECEGGFIKIDDRDIGSMPLKELRSGLAIIPQDPVLFTGSVRYNLDPFNNYSDDACWAVLRRVRLEGMIRQLPDKLLAPVASLGSNFSAGERQLLCMARALLRNCKIVILDEATASVDGETDALIQKMVRTELKGCTVLTIAHRLETILDYDKVIVLSDGRMLEMDSPGNLLANTSSVFYSMVKTANIHGDTDKKLVKGSSATTISV